ncbi:MAG: cation transporter [Leptolyngbya foveolarum]|uniref:Cation transporter n=1 Tax=Leptolyngbya foveolarum TaxID=47253 RepID=A0A2W4WS22_9CYAN|nr:MAG: cation transporter [Leptolyngbya foveolarum]
MPPAASTPLRDRFNLSRLAIRHSWITICCWIAIAVAGLFAFSTIKYALFPDITFPVVVVNATAPIATALESERAIAIPIEKSLQSLDSIDKTLSSTSAGRTVLNLQFQVGTNLSEATAAVEQRIESVSLPADANYEIIPLNLNEATAIGYALKSDRLPITELTAIAKADVLPVLEDIPGVLRADLLGTGVQTQPNAEQGADTFLASLQKAPTLIRFNRETALAVQVVKRGDANTLEVVDRVERAIATLKNNLPDVQFELAATQADYIRAATQATLSSLVGAIVIAVLVIFIFLRSWRATLITALAIPLSLLGTCIVMASNGFNFETITLLALALVIGIVVDDAIVELENIVRHIELGSSPRQAALIATEEIGLTVSASTLTIAAVFLPVAFMGGTVGQFFKPFGLTVSAAVLVSLLVARTLSPVLAAYWLKPKSDKQPKQNDALNESYSPLERRYTRLLAWSLGHRWTVVGVAIASFIIGIALIPLIPQGFIPQLDRGEFYLNYTVPLPQTPSAIVGPPSELGTTPLIAVDPREQILQQTLAAAPALEETVFELPEIESVLTTVGGKGQPNQGSLYIKMKAQRDRTTAEVQAQLRQALPEQSKIVTSIEDVQFVDTGGEKPLQVALLGDDLAVLDRAVTEVKAEIEPLAGFADVQISSANNIGDRVIEINHQNGQRVAFINANLSQGKALGDATNQVVDIAKSIVPSGVRIDLGGDSARSGEVLGSFAKTLAIAVVCMLSVLFIPFGRLLEPAVVGLCLPLSIVGALLALLITRSDFGIVSVLGLLFLLGLLDKNALLMMDYTNQQRRAGMNRTEAILKTGLVRLRPILMTTASTVLGMVPIALGLGAGAELRQPMAVAIIGGLLTSTLLSLVIVPVLYSLLEDGWNRVMGRPQITN